MSKRRRLENGQVEEHVVQEPPLGLDMSPISQIDRRAMLYKNLAIREVDSTMSVGTDLKISTNLKPRVIGETNLSTAKVSFGLKQLAKMAPCPDGRRDGQYMLTNTLTNIQGIITVAHEHGHVMEIYKNHTKHHSPSWLSDDPYSSLIDISLIQK